MMKRRFRSLALLLPALLACPSSIEEQAVVEWIRAEALPLATVEAGHGFADMQPLKRLVGDARIVALGEATHGTREFFQLKHRMLEFLATEMGFTIFSIEANMPEAYRLNRYVLTGEGDPLKLIAGMYFWTWDTEEVLEMVQWMRAYNASGQGRVEFTGFDMQTPDVAIDLVRSFLAEADPDYVPELDRATRLALGASPSRAGFGVATGSFPVKVAAGKTVRFSGQIKTKNLANGFAGLWWRVDGDSGSLAFDNMSDRGAKGTTDWKRYELELPVSADAVNINFGVLHTGSGKAWFDGLAIELDGEGYSKPELMDLDFESPTLTGFRGGGAGYLVELDREVFRRGAQSLRLQFVGADDEDPADAQQAATAWSGVVRHLDESREAYRARGAAERHIEWAVQNARVVGQSMQMLSKEVNRDRSMARNVEWILEQNPGAKIVLWAHNGHVSTSPVGGFVPMGAVLRRTFGDEMVVFGFAFNQGSFQAIEPGKGLRDFTLPPAPAGSLDATLAAAGIPILALDFKRGPASGPVADWLRSSHETRNFGAVYSESGTFRMSPLTPLDSYDAILFVEKTSAARKNRR